MQLLPLIFLAFAHVLTSNAKCSVLPITPTEFNGLKACGSGGIVAADCFCCPDRQTPCQSLLQACSRGLGIGDICVNNPQYFGGSGCASQSLAVCGTGCMPIGATCCSDQHGWCAAGSSCRTQPDGTILCVPSDLSSPNGVTSSPATLGPSTTTNSGSTSPAVTSAQSLSMTPNSSNASPAATSTLSPSTTKNTASSSTSATNTQSSSSVATRKGYSGTSSLLAMLAINVFMFS